MTPRTEGALWALKRAHDEASGVVGSPFHTATAREVGKRIDALAARVRSGEAEVPASESAALHSAPAPSGEARAVALLAALETIAGGYTDRFPGAPDPFANWASPADFRSAMWSWSQTVAKAAIAATLPAPTDTKDGT